VKEGVDLLVVDAAEVVTVADETGAGAARAGGARAGEAGGGGPTAPLRGAAMDRPGVLAGAAIAMRDGRIVAVDAQARVLSRYDAPLTYSAQGGTVLPGLVDAHTHPVFGDTREAEADMRARGRSYVEITAAGGGIFSSVRSLRATSRERLAELLAGRLALLLACGTTSIEAKSGYGLSLESELLALELLAEADARQPVDIDRTCLAAHQVPPEYAQDRAGYVRLVTETILPEVRRRGLARSADVFCDRGAYTVPEARAVLTAARAQGFALRVHADELDAVGAAELAAACGAQTADHLVRITDTGLQALVRAGTTPVLLPGTCFSLRSTRTAPARRMIEAGLPLVIASDFNPGTSYVPSMITIIALACGLLGLTVAEAVTAATRNAAATLGLPGPRGMLAPGAVADLVLLDVPNHLFLGYQLGPDPVRAVVKDGRVVYERGTPRFAA
jgi:imidazolonepropionase